MWSSVRVQAARRWELHHLSAAQIELAAVQRAGHQAAFQAAQRQGRGHVRTAVVSHADALRRVHEQEVKVAPGYPQQGARRHLVNADQRLERSIVRPAGLETAGYFHQLAGHRPMVVEPIGLLTELNRSPAASQQQAATLAAPTGGLGKGSPCSATIRPEPPVCSWR